MSKKSIYNAECTKKAQSTRSKTIVTAIFARFFIVICFDVGVSQLPSTLREKRYSRVTQRTQENAKKSCVIFEYQCDITI